MKKSTLLLFVCTLFITSVKAQLPDGSIAPNFTITDLNGNSHTLYDILDSGYTVVMDLNATWCGPCWSYHQAGHLETLWEEHGPAGWPGVSANTTDDVFVFMIESASNTNLADLQGTGSNTYGDWITGTNFPISENVNVAQDYDLTYYPTVFTVCPNRILTESGAISSAAHYSKVGECNSAVSGKNMSVFEYIGETTICETEVDVKAKFQNMGTDDISAFNVDIIENGSTIGSEQYSGNAISTYEFVELDFGTLNVSGPSTIEVKITTSDVSSSDNSLSQQISFAKEGAADMTLKVTTDNFGSQVTWKIKNADDNSVVASGGPYGNSSDTQNYDPQPQDDETINLDADGCYYFEVYDSQNNGMYSFPTHDDGPSFFRLVSNGTNIVEIFGDEYKNSIKKKFRYKVTSSISENYALKSTSIFPNPTNGLSTLQIDMKESVKDVRLNIFNVLGENILTTNTNLNVGINSIPLNITSLNSGIYTVELNSPIINISQKLIKLN